MADHLDHPTILVIHYDGKFHDVLIRNLQQTGYLILEAKDAEEALRVVVHHSRRIHLLLTDDSNDSRMMAATLKPYRPDMHVIHIREDVELGSVLMELSKALASLAYIFQDPGSSPIKLPAALTAEVDEARSHFLDSTRKFLEAAKDVPSTIPQPDSIARIQRPAYVMRQAFDEYLKARKRLEDHIAAVEGRITPSRGKKGIKK